MIAVAQAPESDLPADAAATLNVLVAALSHLETDIKKLDAGIARRAKENEAARQLRTVNSPMSLGPLAFQWLMIGLLIATALAALAPAARDIPPGSGFCGLARSDAPAAFDRRQASARSHVEDGRTVPATPADHRRQQRHHQAACPCRGQTGHVAGRNADAQATDASAGCAGEQ